MRNGSTRRTGRHCVALVGLVYSDIVKGTDYDRDSMASSICSGCGGDGEGQKSRQGGDTVMVMLVYRERLMHCTAGWK